MVSADTRAIDPDPVALLASAPGEMAEVYADLEANVDPGLVVENAAILIRKTRIKR